MRFRAPDDDAVASPFDEVHVEVGVGLCRRCQRAVALDVCLRHRDRKIVRAAILSECSDAPAVLGAVFLVDRSGDAQQPAQRVAADFLDQHDQRRALGGRQFDERAALQEILRRAGNLVVARVVAAAVVHDAQRPMTGVLGQAIIDGRVVDGDRDHGMGGHVRHPLPAEIDRAPVPQTLDVLLGCSQRHRT